MFRTTGFEGNSLNLNTIFKPSINFGIQNNCQVYESEREDLVFWCHSFRQKGFLWMISETRHFGTNKACAAVKSSACLPEEINGKWSVWNTQEDTWNDANNVKITLIASDASEWGVDAESYSVDFGSQSFDESGSEIEPGKSCYVLNWNKRPLGWSIVGDADKKNAYVHSIGKRINVERGLRVRDQIIAVNTQNMVDKPHEFILRTICEETFPLHIVFRTPDSKHPLDDPEIQSFFAKVSDRDNEVELARRTLADIEQGGTKWKKEETVMTRMQHWWRSMCEYQQNEILYLLKNFESEKKLQKKYPLTPIQKAWLLEHF